METHLSNGAAVLDGLYLPAPMFRALLERHGPSFALWHAAELAALREQGYHRPVLDLGCGDGWTMSAVLRRIEFGIDPDEGALAEAQRLGTYDRLERGPLPSVRLPDQSIGTVVSRSLLAQVPNVDEMLAAIARLLRPGGRLIFTAPTAALNSWLLLRLPGYVRWRNDHLRYRNLWSAERWSRLLERAGLEVEQVRPYLRRNLVAAWDALELTERSGVGRVTGVLSRFQAHGLDRLAERASRLDLSSPPPGGGHLIVARKGGPATLLP